MTYFGKYSGNIERYNLDGGMNLAFTILNWETTDFYIEFISNLEMAKQVGNVSLDPRYAHSFVIAGFKHSRDCFQFKSYLIHDCKHVIDMLPDSNKVVFNRLKFSVSRNLDTFKNRFQIEKKTAQRQRKLRWAVIYGFYPQTKIIDYLNSRPYYHHDFELSLEYPLIFYETGEIFAGIKGRYVISAHSPAKYYKDITFIIEANVFKPRGVLSLYVEYYPVAEDPLKAPEGLSLIALRYIF